MSKMEENNSRKIIHRQAGLESLFHKSEPIDKTIGRTSEIIKATFERYWIQKIAGIGHVKITASGLSMSLPLPRSLLPSNDSSDGNVNTQGDGIYFVFNGHPKELFTGLGHVEWFEVIEVYHDPIAEARDIQSIRRLENGYEPSYSDFDPERFRVGLSNKMTAPNQDTQCEVIDKILGAIKKKLDTDYQKTCQKFGYGTLIIGIPLLFVMCNHSSTNAESQEDNFIKILSEVIAPLNEKIEDMNCPFKSIVVVWTPSLRSVSDWQSQANHDIYRNIVLTVIKAVDKTEPRIGYPRDMRLSVRIDSRSKNPREMRLQDLLN